MSMFPEDDKARKMLPVFKYLSRYFPLAHREVTKVCVVNNVRYNPDRDPADINWARSKSPDQLGSAFRHMMEAAEGKVFEEVPEEAAKATGIKQVYVLAEAMWRIGAELQLTIEKYEDETKVPEFDLCDAPATAEDFVTDLQTGVTGKVVYTEPDSYTLIVCDESFGHRAWTIDQYQIDILKDKIDLTPYKGKFGWWFRLP